MKDRYGWSISRIFVQVFFFNLGTTGGASIEETKTGGFQLAEGCSTCIDENRNHYVLLVAGAGFVVRKNYCWWLALVWCERKMMLVGWRSSQQNRLNGSYTVDEQFKYRP